jgi:CBS domain-containing protein
MDPLDGGLSAAVPAISADATLDEALARMVEARVARLAVVDADGRACGLLPADALVERHR